MFQQKEKWQMSLQGVQSADQVKSRMFLIQASVSSLHETADPRSTLWVLQAPLVPDQHSLVPIAAVPSGLAAVQVGGGSSCLQVPLLLLPDQQGSVLVPEPGVRFRHGLLCQGGATRKTRTYRTLFYCRWITVGHVVGVVAPQTSPERRKMMKSSPDQLRSRSFSVMVTGWVQLVLKGTKTGQSLGLLIWSLLNLQY